MFKSIVRRDVNRVYSYVREEDFTKGFVEGSTFIVKGDEGKVIIDYG